MQLKRYGTYVSTNPRMIWAVFVRAVFCSRRSGWLMFLRSDRARFARLMNLVQDGVLRGATDSVFDLDDASSAFERFGTGGKQGRVLLKLSDA